MISRFFTWWLMVWLFILLMWKISDVTPQLKQASQLAIRNSEFVTIIPVTIKASRRNYPSVIENRGKGFIVRWDRMRSDEIGWGENLKPSENSENSSVFTARHVIADTWYNYSVNWSEKLMKLYHLGWDVGYAELASGIKSSNTLRYNTWLQTNQVLMWYYRDNVWSWLTGTVIWEKSGWVIVDLAVQAWDSGSPVVFADQRRWVVSQSHNGTQAIVEKI